METTQSRPLWRRNLFVLWFGVFMTGMGMSEITPFLSLFIGELGHYSKQQVTFYTGIVFAACFLVMALVSPVWGRLADRKGRRLMLLRASFGMALVFLLMGFVTNVWQLLLLRALQGAFGGYVSNANALIASQAPKKNSGQALSILVTGLTAGTLLGPLMGGALASVFSYRTTFNITGIIMFLVFVLTYFCVKEDFVKATNNKVKAKVTFRQVISFRLILVLFSTTMFVQVVNMSINPILSLFVKELLTSSNQSVTFMAGIVASMPGLSTIIAAPLFGRLGDRIGTQKLLVFGFIFAMLVFFATSFVTNVYQLIGMRILTGISDAAMLPSVQTLLTKNTTTENTSIVFSYNQSFQSLGSVFGPMLGSLVAGIFDYRGVFVVSSLIMVFNLLVFKVTHASDAAQRNTIS